MASITLSNNTIQEWDVSGWYREVGILSVSGGQQNETFTFSLSDTFGGTFKIEATNNGQYRLTADVSKLDYENPDLNQFLVGISASGSNGTNISASTFTVNVTDNNDDPSDIIVTGGTISRNAGPGGIAAELSTVDQDVGDTHEYALYDVNGYPFGVSDPYFKIEGNKVVLKGTAQPPLGTYQLRVGTEDSQGRTHIEEITLTITDGGATPPDNPAPVPAPTNGTPKNDRLSGTEGADVLNGLSGNDKIFGLGGDDIINGGAGKDQLYGGAGMDTFVFDSRAKKGQFDHVKDFVSADDTLQFDLSALKSFKVKSLKKDLLAFAKKGKGKDDMGKPDKKKVSVGLDKVFKEGKLEKKFFKIGKPKDVNDFVTYDKKKGVVYLDVDGSGKAKGIEILKVKPGTTITADDFLFI
ncbi:calcium-binding protein [Microvirga lenta]|uniref:calcium-binding protein n=1 Tax=Microvirga lenta TaxID=2881337 RepID=UPI001CFFFFE0|nr:hypothetical protein [Microvirga lenta]MCB5176835.1 hypothetical protein [Microvirga lenta]